MAPSGAVPAAHCPQADDFQSNFDSPRLPTKNSWLLWGSLEFSAKMQKKYRSLENRTAVSGRGPIKETWCVRFVLILIVPVSPPLVAALFLHSFPLAPSCFSIVVRTHPVPNVPFLCVLLSVFLLFFATPLKAGLLIQISVSARVKVSACVVLKPCLRHRSTKVVTALLSSVRVPMCACGDSSKNAFGQL